MTKPSRIVDPFIEGMRDCRAGRTIEDNRYPPSDMANHGNWQSGWTHEFKKIAPRTEKKEPEPTVHDYPFHK